MLNFISYSYQPIVDYIDAQFEAYLEEELKVIRSLFSYHDTRIHVCLYFISPTGRSLKTIDLLTMRSLDSKVRLGNSSKNLSYFLKHLVAFRSTTTFQFYIDVFGFVMFFWHWYTLSSE